MVSVPLPFITFLLCAALSVLVWRIDLGRKLASICFAGLFALFAVGAFLVGLRFGYGIESFIFIQRTLPLFGGPMLYLGFVALSQSESEFKTTALKHLGVALAIVIGTNLFAKNLGPLDWVISASYLFYIVALVLMWRKGPDHLGYARLDLAPSLGHWMLRGAGLLVCSLLIDAVIAFDFATRSGDNASTIISYASVPFIVILLVLLFALPSFLKPQQIPAKPTGRTETDDAKLEEAARALLTQSQLYLDPELTVERLAKRLHVPIRALSAAVNQTQNVNVSQYVNGFRLSHAAKLLKESDASVTAICTQSGFLTRSNFYREFQRVYGQSPASYRKSETAG